MLRLIGSVIVVAAWVGVALGAAYLLSPDGERLAATAPAGDASQSSQSPEFGAPVDAEAEAGAASFALIPEPESALLAPPAVAEPEPYALPPILSDADAARYKEIFEVQAKAEWQVADYLIAKLEDRRLMGYVQAQRYLHPTGYRSRYEELRVWLASYAELPEADKIYKLALQRRPKGAILPRRPVVARTSIAAFAPITKPPYKSTKTLTRAQRSRVRQLQGRIRRHLGRTELSVTEELLEDPEIRRLFDQVQLDDAYASVAAGWLYYGDYEKANELVAEAARRSGDEVPLANWTAGLAAWRLGEFARAADHFEAYARSDELSGWTAAAGAYWSARAHWQLGDRTQVKYWLIEAARFPRTFYGLLARQRLGQSANFDFRPRPLDAALLAPLQATAAGGRALALLQLGDRERAEEELKAVGRWDDPAVAKGILALAEAAQLPALSYRLASRLSQGRYPGWAPGELDRALYPVPPWRPEGGFVVDRALVYAVMRQESQFKLWAKSREGARGLMQLLPSTASFVAKGRRFTGRAVYELYDPALNIGLGQRYLAQLLKHPRVEGDLFRLAVAYNGGPGNLGKWQRRIGDDDPLLFIESLPTLETRLFIERVLTNLWIYRARLGQPAPSLAAIASGDWPSYQALDGAASRQAASRQAKTGAPAEQDVY